MKRSKTKLRYVVADIGFGYAVHDTDAPQKYGFEAGGDREHPSNNQLNTERVGIFPTRVQAQDLANELNAAG